MRIIGSSLVALRNDDMEWEPYDTSETAKVLFPFKAENMSKHQVPADTLHVLAKKWTRMYAWFLETPVKFSKEIPIQIKKGAQKIQSMDHDSWAVAWNHFQQEDPEPEPTRVKPTTLTMIGLAMKEAFQLLEGNATMLLKTYKPEKSGEIHVAVASKGTAVIVGAIHVREFRALSNSSALQKLEKSGHSVLPSQSRQIHQLKEGKAIYAWMIDKKEVLQPPLTWKYETGIRLVGIT